MTQMASMELDDDAAMDAPQPIPMANKPSYPYGLCICLTADEVEKLGIDPGDAMVGGIFHFEALAKITSVTLTDSEHADGPQCRIEAQITDMGVLSADDD
jgi:hypothetical protein